MQIGTYTSEKINQLSFFFVCLVVLVHTGGIFENAPPSTPAWWLHHLFSKGIGRSAVPFFFAVSGFFLFKNYAPTLSWYLKICKSRFFSLYIPFICWNIFIYTILFAPSALSISNVPHLLGFDFHLFPAYAPLWYIKNLCILVIASPVIGFFVKKRNYDFLWILPLVPTFLLWFVLGRRNYYCIFLDGLLFFLIGSVLAFRKPTLPPLKPLPLLTAWLSLIALATAIQFSTDPGAFFWSGWGGLLQRASLFTGLLAIWVAYDSTQRRLPAWLTATTFFVYCSHSIIQALLAPRLHLPLPVSWLILFFTSLLVSVGLSAAIRRSAPRLNAILTGNR